MLPVTVGYPLFTTAFSHGLAGAPFLLTHIDKDEHDGNRQEDQWPHRAGLRNLMSGNFVFL